MVDPRNHGYYNYGLCSQNAPRHPSSPTLAPPLSRSRRCASWSSSNNCTSPVPFRFTPSQPEPATLPTPRPELPTHSQSYILGKGLRSSAASSISTVQAHHASPSRRAPSDQSKGLTKLKLGTSLIDDLEQGMEELLVLNELMRACAAKIDRSADQVNDGRLPGECKSFLPNGEVPSAKYRAVANGNGDNSRAERDPVDISPTHLGALPPALLSPMATKLRVAYLPPMNSSKRAFTLGVRVDNSAFATMRPLSTSPSQ